MIGIFDSGIGGLTVVKKIFEYMGKYQILYFGDTARTPYGGRGEATIKKYALEDVEFLIKNGAKIIVVACNTASAVALRELKEKITLPIFNVVEPAVNAAIKISRGRIGVIGTRATVESKIYEKLINPPKFFREKLRRVKVFSQAAPLLVPLVEEDWLKKPETRRIVKKYLVPLRANQIDTLILACTHYPFLRKIIQAKIGRWVKIIDPAEEVVKEIKNFLEKNPEIEKELARGSSHQFFVSDLTPKFQELAGKWLDRKIKLNEVEI